MRDINLIPPNILSILDRAADFAARYEREQFHCGVHTDLVEANFSPSPIEMAMHIAIQAVAKINDLEFSEPMAVDVWSQGLIVSPQFRLDRFRADFMVSYHYDSREPIKVIVECDGTAFHERTEPERRKEKFRDRHMQKNGYQVFRYTGKEILADPYKIAAEIISHVMHDYEILTPEEYFS